eukprot:PhM_4_TR3451/c6_g1_i2/m.73697
MGLVLDDARAARQHLLVVLVDGVHEVDAGGVEGLLGHLEVLQRLRLLVLQHRELLLDLAAQLVELLLHVGVLLGVGVERLDAELELDVRRADVAVDLFEALLLLVDEVAERKVQHAEVLKVLLVHGDAHLGQLGVRLVVAGLDGAAALADHLLDEAGAADGQVAVVHRQLEQLLVLRRHLEELRVLDAALLLAVEVVDAALDLLEALGAQLLELALEVLDAVPAVLLLVDVLLDVALALLLGGGVALHGLGVLEVGLLDGVVDVLQVGLAALLEAALGVLHLARVLRGGLLHVVDLLEGGVLVLALLDVRELVLDEVNELLLQLDLRPHLLLRDLHLAVNEGDGLDLLHLLELLQLRVDLLVGARQRRLDLRHVHDVLDLLERALGDLRELRGVELRAAELLLDLLYLGDAVVDHAREGHNAALVPVLLQLLEKLLERDHVHELRLVLGLVQLALRHLQTAHAHELGEVVGLREVPLGANFDGREQLLGLVVGGAELLALRLGPVGDVQLLDELLVLKARRLELEVVDLLLAGSLEAGGVLGGGGGVGHSVSIVFW